MAHHADGSLSEGPVIADGRGDAWLWWGVLVSAVLHVGFVLGLWVFPHGSARSVSYPVYTVDLIGGDRIGGAVPRTQAKVIDREKVVAPEKTKSEERKPLEPITPQKREPEVFKEATKPAEKKEKPIIKETKERVRVKAAEKPKVIPEMQERVVSKVPRREPTVPQGAVEKENADTLEADRKLPAHVREQLIQSALDRLKERTQKSQVASSKKEVGGEQGTVSTNPGQGEGTAALGQGGTGGGVVKGIEFVIYYNRMRQLIKQRWTWGGKRPGLEVTVGFGIREDGQIAGIRVIQASGDSSYDDSVVRAVTWANPLPPPPENYRKEFKDVQLTFRPEDLHG